MHFALCRRNSCRFALDLYCSFPASPRHCRRQASTAASASQGTALYPFPAHRNPTPHQIFHLPRNATENEIKARYYELVRLYHPDKVGSALSSEIAHARFQSITAAYDALRGKTPLGSDSATATQGSYQDRRYQTTAAFRAAQRRRQELYSRGAADDSWKDKIIIFGVVSTILIVVAQTFTTRREVLAQAYTRKRAVHESKSYRLCDEEKLALSANDNIHKKSSE